MIPAGAVIGVFLAVVWAVHHPAPGLLAALALILLATGIVKACRRSARGCPCAPGLRRPGPLVPGLRERA